MKVLFRGTRILSVVFAIWIMAGFYNAASAHVLLSSIEDQGQIVSLIAVTEDANDYLQDPDGTKFEKSIVCITKMDTNTDKMKVFPLGRFYLGYLSDVGGIAKVNNEYQIFINAKEKAGTYNMNGYIAFVDTDLSKLKNVLPVFENQNSGWYPTYYNGYWFHFSSAGYHICQAQVVNSEKVVNVTDTDRSDRTAVAQAYYDYNRAMAKPYEKIILKKLDEVIKAESSQPSTQDKQQSQMTEEQVQKALDSLSAGNYQGAVQYCNEAIKADSKNAQSYDIRAAANLNLGNLDQAIQDAQAAIKLAPTYAAAYNNLGLAYFAKNQLDQAENCFNKAIELAPGLQQFRDNLSKVRGQKEANQQAYYDTLAEKYPIGSKVEVLQWERLIGLDYGYAGIVRDINGHQVTLEVYAFLNVNTDVEPKWASGGVHLIKGEDVGVYVTTDLSAITGYYYGSQDSNYKKDGNDGLFGNLNW